MAAALQRCCGYAKRRATTIALMTAVEILDDGTITIQIKSQETLLTAADVCPRLDGEPHDQWMMGLAAWEQLKPWERTGGRIGALTGYGDQWIRTLIARWDWRQRWERLDLHRQHVAAYAMRDGILAAAAGHVANLRRAQRVVGAALNEMMADPASVPPGVVASLLRAVDGSVVGTVGVPLAELVDPDRLDQLAAETSNTGEDGLADAAEMLARPDVAAQIEQLRTLLHEPTESGE